MKLPHLSQFFVGTLRGRLILGVAAVHAVMMSLFIADLTWRQRAVLLEHQITDATSMSQALAVSAAEWIASDDISGLQELVEVQRQYPGTKFLILTDKEGRVLAGTDTSKLGLYLQHLPAKAQPTFHSRTSALVDITIPALLEGRQVGWVRVGIGQEATGEHLAGIIRNGIIYAAAAILIGSLIAWFMGRRISRRLYVVQETIDAVRSGDRQARSRVGGNDEAAVMAREFNSMLDELDERDEEVRAGETKYRTLIQKIQAAVVVHGPDMKIVSCNPMAQELLGLTEDQLLGRSVIDPARHFIRDDGTPMPDYEYPAARVFSSRKPLKDFSVGLHRPDRDDNAWVLFNADPVFDDHGEITQVIVTFIDITERKRAEEALKTSEQKFRSLFEESLDCLFVTTPDGRVLDINKSGISLFGYDSKEEILRLDLIRDVYANPEERQRALEQVGARGQAEYDAGFKKKNGEQFTGHCLLYAVKDENGIISSYRGSLRDVTDKILAEKSLRLAKEDWERTFDAVADLVFIQDLNGHIRRANRALCDRLGKTAEQIAGTRCCALMHDDHMAPEKCPRALMFRDGNSHISELTESRLGGSFLVNVSPIRDTDGNVIGSVHVARDVTETKRLQELESRAQRLDTAGRIAGQVAHDLNNLLAPITAYPELIRELLPPKDPSQKYLDAIESAGIRIADINQQLLTLSRRGHYNQNVLNLNDIVAQAINDLGQLPDRISCRTELLPELMNIRGGGAQLHRVILNLLINARDAIKESGTIYVKTENIYIDEATIKYDRVPKGEYVKVTITDTGSGIPQEIIQKIFDPFFTTKATDKRRGSGLGLSVVDAVMKDHGGRIDLSTEINKGTSFSLYFPITRECTVVSEEHGEAPTGQESILVVDDDDVQRDVLCKLLFTLGYTLTSCEKGERAIEVLRHKPQDLIILDMIMPGGMDGVETYRAALRINPNQRAIIVSGFSETEKVHEAQALGAGAFIRKPLNRSIIAAAVRTELDRAAIEEPALQH